MNVYSIQYVWHLRASPAELSINLFVYWQREGVRISLPTKTHIILIDQTCFEILLPGVLLDGLAMMEGKRADCQPAASS